MAAQECVDCLHRWKYHSPRGCLVPACSCAEPDALENAVPCSDGSFVHDFKGGRLCAGCGRDPVQLGFGSKVRDLRWTS